jgi:hypothetical protein
MENIFLLKSIIMKINFFRKTLFSALAIAGTALIITSCDKDDDDDDDDNNKTYTISGNASGAQEVPAVTTTATGALSGTYNARTNTLDYNISWTGLSGVASAAHFHGPAAAGVSADVLVPITITTNGVAGTATGSVVIVDSVENALLDGKVYYNIHTVAHPLGEIRGQVATSSN